MNQNHKDAKIARRLERAREAVETWNHNRDFFVQHSCRFDKKMTFAQASVIAENDSSMFEYLDGLYKFFDTSYPRPDAAFEIVRKADFLEAHHEPV